jgi:hypothetical protein
MSRRRRGDPPPLAPCRCAQDLLPLTEIAARLDQSEQTTLRLHRLGALPIFKLGMSWFGSWQAIESWARSRPQNRGTE